jgi:Arc/MetJ family transcription regulator
MNTKRTNIEIDQERLEQVKKIIGTETTKDTVNSALSELVRIDRQRKILEHRGMGGCETDLRETRGRH